METPAVSPRTWLWWSNEQCESEKTPSQINEAATIIVDETAAGQLLVPPPPNYGISYKKPEAAPTYSAGDNILTSIKPKNVSLMTSDERVEWELKNVFNHIYMTIQHIMRHWIDPCWRPVIDACFWSTIESSGGNPKLDPEMYRNIVFISEAYNAISLKFGEPNILFITCAQWHKYTALTNALSRIQATIRIYELMRERMDRPWDYIEIHLTELFPGIDRDRYFVNQSECFDYDRIRNPTIEYPWHA